MINQFVTLLATFIGEGPYATNVAWGVTIVLMLFALWLLRWLFNWFFKANEIVANQEHIIELLEARAGALSPARQVAAAPVGLNMRPPAPLPAAPVPIRQHPIDEEFSEILNVRPHNLSTSSSAVRQSPVPPVFTPTSPIPTAPIPTAPIPTSPIPTSPTLPAQPEAPRAMPSFQPVAIPNASQEPTVVKIPKIEPGVQMEEKVVVPVPAKPANTSVTMLGSPEARAERQMEAREAMRLAAQAANSTLSKTADIPDIPTALVRTYSTSKTNPLTGKRAVDRSATQSDGENGDAIPSQFQLRDRKS